MGDKCNLELQLKTVVDYKDSNQHRDKRKEGLTMIISKSGSSIATSGITAIASTHLELQATQRLNEDSLPSVIHIEIITH